MPLERYALGTGSHDTFSYRLEFGTPHVGSIKGGSAKKHLIYRKKDGTYFFDPQYQTVQAAWDAVRAAYVQAFDLAERGEFAAISGLAPLSGGPAVVAKALYIYFPDRFLPIFSSDHLRKFLERILPDAAAAGGPALNRNRQFFEAAYAFPEFQGWSPQEVMRYLYWWADPRDVVVKIAPGHDAKFWPECRAGGYICIGWDKLGDLREYASEEDFRKAFAAQGQ